MVFKQIIQSTFVVVGVKERKSAVLQVAATRYVVDAEAKIRPGTYKNDFFLAAQKKEQTLDK